MDKTFFKIEGKVRENIIRRSGDNWVYTNFLVTAFAGKNKEGKTTFNNFPIFCWYDADVQEGDEVVVFGELSMRNDGNGKYSVRLIADKNGIAFKLKTKLQKSEDKPKELDKAEQIFAEDLSKDIEYSDPDIPF